MNKHLIIAAGMAFGVLAAQPCMAQTSPYDELKPVGWASVDGETTGSNDENPVTVTTLSELKSVLSGTSRKTVYIKGIINFSGLVTISGAKNKTVYGLPGSALVNGDHSTSRSESGVLGFSKCENIILRNITFKSAGAYDMDGNDNLSFTGCKRMWVDHCDFQDGVDGNFDCSKGSDYVTVTWCRFRYLIAPWPGGSGGSADHRNCNLWGGGDGSADQDQGHLRTTFANCWWDEGCRERMPRVRFGQVHVVNCLYTCTGNNYCVGAGYKSNLYVDRCAFVNVNRPWKKYATSGSYTDYNITVAGCDGAKDEQVRSGSADYFVPSAFYTLDGYDVSLVEQVVGNPANGAGATLPIEEGAGVVTALQGISHSHATIVSTTI